MQQAPRRAQSKEGEKRNGPSGGLKPALHLGECPDRQIRLHRSTGLHRRFVDREMIVMDIRRNALRFVADAKTIECAWDFFEIIGKILRAHESLGAEDILIAEQLSRTPIRKLRFSL